MNTYPSEAIAVLRRFSGGTLTGEEWKDSIVRGWLALFEKEGLIGREPSTTYLLDGSHVRVMTDLGWLALKLHDERPAQDLADYPPEFREGGKPDGEPLTCAYLERSTDWQLTKSYVSSHYKADGTEVLTKRVKLEGKRLAYDYKELLALRDLKTKNTDRGQ